MNADPSGVDLVTGEVEKPLEGPRLRWEPLTYEQAKHLTTQIQGYSKSLCMLVLEAHDAGAWSAMGYESWEAYCDEQFDHMSRQRAHQLVEHARKMVVASELAQVSASTMVSELPERVTRGLSIDQIASAVEAAVNAIPPGTDVRGRVKILTAIVRELRRADALPTPEVLAPAEPPAEGTTRTVKHTTSTTVTDTTGRPSDASDDEADDLDGEVSAPTSPSNLSPDIAADDAAAEGDSTGGGDPDTVDPPSDLDGTDPGATIDPENTDAASATDDAAGEAGEPAASPSEAPADPTGVSTPAAPVGSPSIADLLGLVYAAIDADWAYYSPGVAIDRESFWLPLAVHLESAVES